MSLSDVKIRTAKPEEKRYTLLDSDGLYLEVMVSGKKYWHLRYASDGKRSWHTIGEYPAIGLQEARERKNTLRQRLRDGESIKKKRYSTLFRDVALEWADMHDRKISNENDRAKKRNRMNNHILPFLGDKDISDITSMDVLPILQRLADRQNFEMMARIRSIVSQIFRFAVATGRAQTDPTYALRGAIIAPKAKHYASLRTPEEVGALMLAIDSYPQRLVRRAMQFSAFFPTRIRAVPVGFSPLRT